MKDLSKLDFLEVAEKEKKELAECSKEANDKQKKGKKCILKKEDH